MQFTPKAGHEQEGYRPAIVVSNDEYNRHMNLAIVCPITSTKRNFPLHVPLDKRTRTFGYVMCEQVKALDLDARTYKVVEHVPDDILEKVIDIVLSEVEILN